MSMGGMGMGMGAGMGMGMMQQQVLSPRCVTFSHPRATGLLPHLTPPYIASLTASRIGYCPEAASH